RATRQLVALKHRPVRSWWLVGRWAHLWGDDEPCDVLAGNSEVPVQVGGAAGEVAGQAAGDEVAVGAECFGGGDLGRVCVFRGCAGLPGADRRRAVAFFAFVDDGG